MVRQLNAADDEVVHVNEPSVLCHLPRAA